MTVRDWTAAQAERAPIWQTGMLIVSQLFRQGQCSWWMIGLIWIAASLPAKAELELRVAIAQDVGEVKVGGSTEALLRDGSGQVLAQVPAMNAVVAAAKGGKVVVNQLETRQLWVEPVAEDGYVLPYWRALVSGSHAGRANERRNYSRQLCAARKLSL